MSDNKHARRTEPERMIQEYVPGKQITLAHIIANPDKNIFTKLGLSSHNSALGILTITPSEASMIASDIATKSGNVELEFIDRVSGSVVVSGEVSEVEAALKQVVIKLKDILDFTICDITRT